MELHEMLPLLWQMKGDLHALPSNRQPGQMKPFS
ncbi:hypothetical protein BVRB_6g149780 [Beta vulgaris subsp. vulgaris]|nr:hypothetical protein BVRB_6g149780 [Beta vulgaris subsp. vulgaris]